MRLKIVHQNQENRVGDDREMKKEEEVEHTHVGITPGEESMKETSSPLNPSPISTFDPVLVYGKRKRKPKEIIDEISPILRRRKKPSTSKSKDAKRDSAGTLMCNGDATNDGSSSAVTPVQVKSPTMIRAEEVQSSLGNEHPGFLKTLVRSHVASCFWMGLPVPFCKLFLPNKDTTVTIEDENGEEFGVKYIANKTGLSAGWRKFVSGNKLLEGDVLIFQLVGPCRFKVYVIRANDLTEVDGALSLLILDSQTKQNDAAEGTADVKIKKRRPKSLPLTVVQKKKQKAGQLGLQLGPLEEQSGNDSDEVASEVFEGSKCSGSSIHFKDIKSFEEFHIVVNGVCIDSEIPEHVRQKYYELCRSKNAFLHEGLLPGLHCKLAAGMIFEAVNTADAIRSCKLTTPREDFEVWEKSLRSFELLGLNVGFLGARLCRVLKLAFDSEGAVDAKKYWEAKTKRARTEEGIRDLEVKLVELKEASAKFDAEIESLKSKAESYELMFQEEVNAPW
ncbi:B3 domain-containing protein Os01g0234100-like [Olea europaea var. sylvestris]|uniref:B3 domain-containing protein Os01g0234100-like n=1 Tax=Olea europaea var. sylvestris TaxID=158386 RepID=UPI000C1CE0C4|nr:B3 domain-containing protein Os01g0234100-like [Olea europaea var. sylvestris]